ncbi:MAG: Bax inhibitor-1/YccA family protein [Anaplasmataceae bacterium]|nr:Bax inhibitor-1/YccA family protein [Anaplasmataceae bacterium]
MSFIDRQSRASSSSTHYSYDEGLRKHLCSVYNYMGMALAVTGVTSMFVASSQTLLHLFLGTPLQWVIMFAPLIMVFVFAAKINSMSFSAARTVFFVFSAVMGISLAPIFIIYTGQSIAKVFFISASLFGSMAIYGNTTKKDLTSMGSFLMMGVIGLIIASVVNLFMNSSALSFAISGIGVVIFVGMTAYDAQKIKDSFYQNSSNGEEALAKSGLMGALTLYFDFINIFIYLLRLLGDQRDR